MKAHGPGRYDAETLELLERLEAKGVLVIVVGGNRGNGVSAKGDMQFMNVLPTLLEGLAAELRRDLMT